MDGDAIAQTLFDASVRFEHLWWIPGICASPPTDFQQFVEDDMADSKYVIGPLSFLEGMLEAGAEAEDILAEMNFKKRLGFIAQAVTPIPNNFGKDGSYSFSWARCQTVWLYADTLEELASLSTVWAAKVVADAKKQQKAA